MLDFGYRNVVVELDYQDTNIIWTIKDFTSLVVKIHITNHKIQ